VPGLDVRVTVLNGEERLFTHPAEFLWHPFLHHDDFDAREPWAEPTRLGTRRRRQDGGDVSRAA
jgi:hypothetical protein